MKKTLLRAISLVLCFVMIASIGTVGTFAAEKQSDCGDDCEFYPTIIIPGLGQSSVCVTDDEGKILKDDEGKNISAFPAYIQLDKVIKEVALPLVFSLATQKDMGLSDALADAIELCFGINSSDLNAQNTGNVVVEKFPYSFAECSDYEMSIINSHIPFNLYPTDLPDDHLYYFCYNSFGNHIDLANELYDYIQMVKEQTGHDKVNIVPISQGGTIASAMFEYKPQVMDELHKVLFIVPALDGSTIIGDVFNGRITFLDKDFLYNGFLENLGLLDHQTARMIEVIARILPDEVLVESLRKAVTALVEKVMIRSTSMWALCPSGDYLSAAEKYLSTPEMASIKEQTYKYYQAQLHCKDNIQALVDKGVQVFCVAEYDFAMIDVGETWNTQNADFIIQLDSTSMGAYAAKVGEILPEDYVQQNTYCDNPEHNHISPDRVVDASTGLLPDTTFYFDNQRHDLTQHNSIILKIAMQLIAHDDIKDVYSSPEFPQFNHGRDVRNITALLEQAKAIDSAKLSADDAAELAAAIKQGEEALAATTAPANALPDAEARLTSILVKAGALEVEKKKENSFFNDLSLWLYENYGTNGFSEMPGITVNKLWESFKSLFTNLF